MQIKYLPLPCTIFKQYQLVGGVRKLKHREISLALRNYANKPY